MVDQLIAVKPANSSLRLSGGPHVILCLWYMTSKTSTFSSSLNKMANVDILQGETFDIFLIRFDKEREGLLR